MKVKSRQGGFTLLEVMVVVVILGILAALVVPKIISRPDEARVIAAKQDIASVMQALKLYRLDNQRYPTTEQGLQALVARPNTGPIPPNWKAGGYLERLPRDPWGNPWQYLNPGLHGEIDIFSFGADGAPGGEGNDADIGSWTL
jgi:general secretion pathway protein G